MIDSQSAKTCESGGPRGFDAGKASSSMPPTSRIATALRWPCFDPLGHRSAYPWLRHVFADGGYAGPKLEHALAGQGDWTVEIVKRPNAANGFVISARRWVVERTLAWLGRCRRLAKDFEVTIEKRSRVDTCRDIRRLTRKLARP